MELVEHVKPDAEVNKDSRVYKRGTQHYARVHDLDNDTVVWWLENQIPVLGESHDRLEAEYQALQS